MMKKSFLFLFIGIAGVLILAGCFKSEVPAKCTNGYTLEKDKQVIDSFLDKKGLTGVLTYDAESEKGFYAGVTLEGTGSMPTVDSLVAYTWTVSLMDGTEISTFTIKAPAEYTLNQIAQQANDGVGFYALPKLKEGGKMKIIIPSSRAYSCNTVPTANGKVIPANSQLIYDVTLTDVKKGN